MQKYEDMMTNLKGLGFHQNLVDLAETHWLSLHLIRKKVAIFMKFYYKIIYIFIHLPSFNLDDLTKAWASLQVDPTK